jgi:hypothetical protein
MGCGGSKSAEAAVPVQSEPEKPGTNGNASSKTPGGPTPSVSAQQAPSTSGGPQMLEEEESSDTDMMVRIFYPDDIDKRSAVPVIIYGHGRYVSRIAYPGTPTIGIIPNQQPNATCNYSSRLYYAIADVCGFSLLEIRGIFFLYSSRILR